MKNANVQKCSAEHDESKAMGEIESHPRLPQIDPRVKSNRRLLHRHKKTRIPRREIARLDQVCESENSMYRAEQQENTRAGDKEQLDHANLLMHRPGGFLPIDTHA